MWGLGMWVLRVRMRPLAGVSKRLLLLLLLVVVLLVLGCMCR